MTNREGSIIVTGASGWMGQTLLENLFEVLGASTFYERVIAFASKDIDAKIGRAETIKLHSLSKLPKLAEESKPDLIIHAAFLTPDYAKAHGRAKFIQINRKITGLVCKAAKNSPNSRLVEISSGAAETSSETIDNPNKTNLSDQQLYGFLKKEEEEKLSLLAPTLILRIFALSGKHIKDPKKYALGDFLLAHAKGQPIVIQSKTPVIRGYGHAGDISKLAITADPYRIDAEHTFSLPCFIDWVIEPNHLNFILPFAPLKSNALCRCVGGHPVINIATFCLSGADG
jgi:nucleoside-diphosphate-sugar epimerase